MKLLLTFIILNILNVIIQTIKSIATIKCEKGMASIVNAIAYGLYTIVLVYTMCDLPLMAKALIVGLCNLVGVYVVKFFEEKARKDKLWLIKVTVPSENAETAKSILKSKEISFSFVDIEKYIVFDCYCNTQKETTIVTDMAKLTNGKCFATENKL